MNGKRCVWLSAIWLMFCIINLVYWVSVPYYADLQYWICFVILNVVYWIVFLTDLKYDWIDKLKLNGSEKE